MRRGTKVKVTPARIPLRKSASGSGALRRPFPAWIDAGERGVAFAAACTVTPRIRDALVLRVVSKGKRPGQRKVSHGASAR